MPRPRDFAILSLAVMSSFLGWVAWRQHREIERLTRVVAARADAEATSTLTLRTATKRTLPIPPRAPNMVAAAPGNANGPAQDGLPRLSAEPARQPSRRRGSVARLMENPEFLQALSVQRQTMLDARFAGLFRQLKLPDDVLAAFKNLLVEKENVALEVVAVSEAMPGAPVSAETLRSSVRTARAQIEQAIESSLGSERYEVYREFERTIPQRATVNQLEQRLSYTSSPLTPAQSEALVRIMVAHAPAAPAETTPALSVVLRSGVPEAVPLLPTNAATGRVTEEVVAQAQSVLAPTQVTALREIQNEQQAASRTAQIVRDIILVTDDMPTNGLLLLQ